DLHIHQLAAERRTVRRDLAAPILGPILRRRAGRDQECRNEAPPPFASVHGVSRSRCRVQAPTASDTRIYWRRATAIPASPLSARDPAPPSTLPPVPGL